MCECISSGILDDFEIESIVERILDRAIVFNEVSVSEHLDNIKYNSEYEEYINISKLDFISNVDICAIFSNALDNAIEACINIDTNIEKRIDVKVTYINQFCILKFTNSKSNEIKFVNQDIQTNKSDKSVHGIGLASIKYIVKKYDGEVIIDYSNDEFILKIMIPIKW